MTAWCGPGGSAWLLDIGPAGVTRTGAVIGDAVCLVRAGDVGWPRRRSGPARPGGIAGGRRAPMCAPSRSWPVVGTTPWAPPSPTVVCARRGSGAVVPGEDRAEVRAPRYGAGRLRCRVRGRDLVWDGQPGGGRRPPA